jgi:pyridoxine 4-dehydrogenase
LVIATKGGLVRPSRRSWVPNGRPEHLRRAVEGSLRRLRLERIDLYQFHHPDPNVLFAESIGALADLKGKIRHLSISNVTVAQLDLARSITPIVSVQNLYNLRNRTSEDVLAACQRLGIAFLPWSLGWQTWPKGNQDKTSRLASRSHARCLISCVAAR